ncbi:MAG: LamG-like jellyroll fold domain-containing protein [Cyanobacteria bacterium J06643_4]
MQTASMSGHSTGNPHSMGDDPIRHKEYNDLKKLIDSVRPTHTAVRSGAWSDPRTWGGTVPGNNAKVLIKSGTTVTYDLDEKEGSARIQTIAIKGNLKFATNQNTKLLVETIINGADGQLDIGSAGRTVAADKKTQIIFTSDRAINKQWDPKQLSKGLISHGTVNIYGAGKQDKVALAGDVKAGSNVLRFKEPLTGWRVGDRIVLGGTNYRYGGKDADNSRFQDEVLTITKIRGKEISFLNENITSGDRTVLKYDHTRSTLADTNKLNLYAGNLTRNVTFETENGKQVPINRRAHVMLMHNPNVTVMNAGFRNLGRTDKSRIIDDVGKNVDGSNGRGSNIRGRYGLHLHRLGTENKAAIIRGNAVEGSPGWGIAHHDSNAGLEDNIVFDVTGAGIAAESGNEVGWWTNNLVVKTTGIPYPQASRERKARAKRFDFGIQGDGYWVQGASRIAQRNNAAISSNNLGLALFSGDLDTKNLFRDAKTFKISALPPELRKLFPADQKEVDVRDVPMAQVTGFESANANVGMQIWGHMTNFDGELNFSTDEPKSAHQARSLVDNFRVWGNRFAGVRVSYNTNVDLSNGTILGNDNGNYVSGGQGLFDNHANFGSKFNNLTIAGFEQGAEFESRTNDQDFLASTLQNSRFLKNNFNLGKPGDKGPDMGRPDDFPAYLKFKNNRFEPAKGNRAPTAKFVSKAAGGLAVAFDASGSFDTDPLKKPSPRKLDSKGIVAYGWDFDGDGVIDDSGREVTHRFNKAGNRQVTLSVLDSQGQMTSVKKTVNVRPTAYSNAFDGGDFSNGTKTVLEWQNNSQYADDGWYVSKGARIGGGQARLSTPGDYSNFIGQVTRNEKLHRGEQTLSFRLKNIEGAPEKNFWEKNEVSFTLWGVNGQFDNHPWDKTGPTRVGTLPMQRRALVSKSYGGEGGAFFDWKNLSFDVNLGQGYDYLMFQMNTERTSNAKDYVALDNLSLSGRSNATGGNPNPPSNPNPTPPNPNPTPPNPPKPPLPGPTFPKGLSPVARLSFDEESGKLAVDTSTQGRDNSGRLVGGAKWDKGRLGGAVRFAGKQDAVNLGKSRDIDLGTHNQRTVSMWFKADKASGNKKQVIYEEGGRDRGLNIYLEDDLLRVGGWGGKWKGNWIESSQVKSGKWHHVALVLDGTGRLQDDAMTAYLDGEKIDSGEGTKLWSHRDGIGIGNVSGTTRFQDGTIGRRGQGLVGSVDEFQVYKSALSDSQVQQLSNGFV